jgi:predicted Zn-dependent protease
MPEERGLSLAQMTERLEQVLRGSPAAATEMVWIEAWGGRESTGKRRREAPARRESMVLVRVRESGRTGVHRTSAGEVSELENALRDALAQARLAPASAAYPLAGNAGPAPQLELYDDEVAQLTPGRARERLQKLADGGEAIRLSWAEVRMALVNSSGLRRAFAATAAAVAVACGHGAGAGSAAAAARSWKGLSVEGVLERARLRNAGLAGGNAGLAGGNAGTPPLAEIPTSPVPLLFSPEAAAALLDLLNRHALSSTSFLAGTSLLCHNLGNQVFHPAIGLRDDGTDPRGLPFPCDLFGWAKRPVDLIAGGVVLTPALDPELGAALGRTPTPHQVAPDESLASNLFLLPGTRPEAELLRAAEGGLWVGALDALECFAPASLRFRAVLRGVRRLEGGSLGPPLADLVWEDSLASALSRVLGIGTEAVSLPTGDDLLGATTTPLLALDSAAALRPYRT